MRTLALLAGVLTAFTLVTPIANFIGTLHQIAAPRTVLTLMTIGGMAVVALLASVRLLFFFALYRDRGMLHVPRRMRFLGRGAALLLGTILAADLTKASLWHMMWNPFTVASMTNAVNLLLMGLSIALLIALSRNLVDKPSEEIPVGRLLRVASEVNAKMAGLVLIFVLLGLLVVPYSYSLALRSIYETGRTLPPVSDLLLAQIRTVLLQFCGFVMPLIVYRASRGEEQSDGAVANGGIVEGEEPLKQI
jgi:hypothetical protein